MLKSTSTKSSLAPVINRRSLSQRENNNPLQAPKHNSLGVAGIILFFILFRLGDALLPATGKPPMSFPLPFGSTDSLVGLITIYVTTIGGFLVTGLLAIVLHEIVHGLVSLAGGYWPRLERGKFEYAGAAYDGQLTPNQLICISLAPLFILSLAIMPLLLVPWLKFFALIALAGNVAGSLDDVRLAYRVWQASHFASVSKASC